MHRAVCVLYCDKTNLHIDDDHVEKETNSMNHFFLNFSIAFYHCGQNNKLTSEFALVDYSHPFVQLHSFGFNYLFSVIDMVTKWEIL